MFNNRKIILELQNKIEALEYDIEVKQRSIENLSDANKELALDNQALRSKIRELILVNRKLEKINCELNMLKEEKYA